MIHSIKISPISINKCWQGKRFKTPHYKSWRTEAGWLLKKNPKYTGWITVEMDFYIVNYALFDVDNMAKPSLDALVENRIIEDDRYIKWIKAEKFKVTNKKDEKIIFSINQYDNLNDKSMR